MNDRMKRIRLIRVIGVIRVKRLNEIIDVALLFWNCTLHGLHE